MKRSSDKLFVYFFRFILAVLIFILLWACTAGTGDPSSVFQQPPESAKPWVFWYWMHASVSREGITADLEAMKEAGIGGAYLMTVKGVTDPPLYEPPVEQLSREWWEIVLHAMNEADRLVIKLAMHASDGFALAGGPWITPEQSMQKIVWTETNVNGGRQFDDTIAQPITNAGYYRDIAVFAFPMTKDADISTRTVIPEVTTSKPGVYAQYLVVEGNREMFRSDDPCWIKYSFDKPFTCRSVKVRTNGNNYQSHRLLIEVSNDDKVFKAVGRLEPPRHGWQDSDADVTHVIQPTTAKYFRFRFNREGSEPGSEDLDAAKWKPSLKICGIELSGAPRIYQFEGKTGEVWRISRRTTSEEAPGELCVPLDKIINITRYMDNNGRLVWNIPEGYWTILRMGHTSTGHTNYTGGAGLGLECDKFDPEVVKIQFDKWFGEAVRTAGPDLASRVLKIFHTDSWECGSQNWSRVFREEFKKRRGYDLFPYMPVMAGIPVQSIDVSERFLHDIRQTIAELVVDNFFGTMAELAGAKGCKFSAECVAPTMTSDGMLHYKMTDLPMGEFWINSPTHDKLNDILDAVSGAHIYNKPVVQAEAFSQLRMAWNEHPAMLKTAGDRNYALGINRFVYHVFCHNPWLNRKPGMTLDRLGLYFQRDQTWWNPGKVWIDYIQRCQALLQMGNPVVDIAVFTGEETPRRAVLPDRLVHDMPGIFGTDVVEHENQRLTNKGEPLREIPDGVKHSANMADPEDWVNPLKGYKYDSFNKDALLRLAKVRKGRIELPGGMSYGLLVIPGTRKMSPNGSLMSPEVAARLLELVKAGATLLVFDRPDRSPGLENFPKCDEVLNKTVTELWNNKLIELTNKADGNLSMWKIGKGLVVKGPFLANSFEVLGLEKDLIVKDNNGLYAEGIAWTHRTAPGLDIYFISSQHDVKRTVDISLRTSVRIPELYDPVTGEIHTACEWQFNNGRIELPVRLEPGGSIFIVLHKPAKSKSSNTGKNWVEPEIVQSLGDKWLVTFLPDAGGPESPVIFKQLYDWSKHSDQGIRYYSGTASYEKTFNWTDPDEEYSRVWIDAGLVANIAEIELNGISCGTAWTPPYRIEITSALRQGENELVIKVTNTWANRLIGDHSLPEAERITWTTAPYRLKGKSLLEAGLLGPVTIQTTR